MNKKIAANIDQQILLALSMGESNKSIAAKYNVSTSYVSKVKTGKKIPSIKLIEPTLIKDEFFKVDNKELLNMLIALHTTEMLLDIDTSIIEYLEVQMKKCLIHAKMYETILNKIKEKK